MPRLVPRERKPSAKLVEATDNNAVTMFKGKPGEAKNKAPGLNIIVDDPPHTTPARPAKKQKKNAPKRTRFELPHDAAIVYDLELLKQKKHQRAAKEHARVSPSRSCPCI